MLLLGEKIFFSGGDVVVGGEEVAASFSPMAMLLLGGRIFFSDGDVVCWGKRWPLLSLMAMLLLGGERFFL